MQNNQGQPESEAPVVPTADGTETPVETTTVAAPASETTETPTTEKPAEETPSDQPPAEEPAAGSKVTSVGDYQKKLDALTAEAPSAEPTPGKPAEEKPKETPEETPAESTPKPEDTQPAETAAQPEKPKNTDFRPRLNGLPPEEQEAIALRKTLHEKGETVTLAECIDRVKAKYSTTQPAETPADTTPARTVEQVQADIEAAQSERKNAIRALDPDKQFEAEDKIHALQKEVQEIERRALQAHESAQASFDQKVEASRDLTSKVYPSYLDDSHQIHQKAEEIYARLESQGNPLITQEDCPFKVYQMAANELGIAPKDPNAAPPAAPASAQSSSPVTPKPQAVSQTAVVRKPVVAPVSASARTQHGTPKASVGKSRTPEDYEAKLESLRQ